MKLCFSVFQKNIFKITKGKNTTRKELKALKEYSLNTPPSVCAAKINCDHRGGGSNLANSTAFHNLSFLFFSSALLSFLFFPFPHTQQLSRSDLHNN